MEFMIFMSMEFPDYFKVAIIGRPNVGKSSIFNRLAGERISIVDFVSGITRDRISTKVTFEDKIFALIDTGGFFEGAKGNLECALISQLEEGIREADLVLLVTDVMMGLHPMDQQILLNLKQTEKPFLLVINKVDNSQLENAIYEFTQLGVSEYFPVSALHGNGMKTLLRRVSEFVPDEYKGKTRGPKISVVGKPNVGKSSFINKILNCNRTIVNETPGTTRDAVFIDFIYNEKSFTLIDTAGLTRRSKIKEAVDSYAILRAKDAISHSNLVILMMDADRSIEGQDMRIARLISDSGRCCIMVINKWDLVKGVRQEHYKRFVYEKMSFMRHVPLLFVSVLQNKNHYKVMDRAVELMNTAFTRISTPVLNEAINNAYKRYLPPYVAGKRLKIYYTTQISTSPPTFVLFVNHPKSAVTHYLKYIENQLREAFQFTGMPIRFKLKARREE